MIAGIGFQVLYVAGILLGGWLIYRVVAYFIARYERQSVERIKKLKRFDPVRANTVPIKDHTEAQREQALDALDVQFSIIRRTFFSVLLVIWIAIALFPFVTKISAGFISVVGAGGAVLIGIAARPFLENLISGYVITFSKQFRRGDTIMVDGEYGTIEDITPTHTRVKLWDWRRYLVPNSGMLGKDIFHYTVKEGFIWARLKFYLAYDTDFAMVRDLAVQAGRESAFLAGEDDPKFWVMGMEKEAVECWLAMWAAGPLDAWSIRAEVGEKLITAFAKHKIKTHSFEIHPDGKL